MSFIVRHIGLILFLILILLSIIELDVSFSGRKGSFSFPSIHFRINFGLRREPFTFPVNPDLSPDDIMSGFQSQNEGFEVQTEKDNPGNSRG